MTTIYAPSYYKQFQCLADRCRHTCCVGWDIPVDDHTAGFYKFLVGPFEQWLFSHIARDPETQQYAIVRDEEKRCPFLRKDGLCSIIDVLGKSSLCQVCRDHPRFRTFFSDRVEMGLGCCCEAAAALVLSQKAPLTLVTVDEDESSVAPAENDYAVTPEEERAFFERRKAWFAILAEETRPFEERCEQLLSAAHIDHPALSNEVLYKIYKALERLDPSWDTMLDRLLLPSVTLPATLDAPLTRLAEYFLYRHAGDALADEREASCIAFAVYSTRLIAALCREGTFEELCEVTRAYCAEIEYSEENLDILLNTF